MLEWLEGKPWLFSTGFYALPIETASAVPWGAAGPGLGVFRTCLVQWLSEKLCRLWISGSSLSPPAAASISGVLHLRRWCSPQSSRLFHQSQWLLCWEKLEKLILEMLLQLELMCVKSGSSGQEWREQTWNLLLAVETVSLQSSRWEIQSSEWKTCTQSVCRGCSTKETP